MTDCTARIGSSKVGSWGRHLLWRGVWDILGGVTITGPRPVGPAILVANHSSHADTPALLAAMPPSSRPAVVAAADYWFDKPFNRAVVSSIVPALPVRRHEHGAYEGLRAAVAPVLERGGVVVIFPEGTRSTSDKIGGFAPGAVRLADEFDVPLIPCAILGTRDVLPKSGSLRKGPTEVRFGHAFNSDGLAADRLGALMASKLLREEVEHMRDRAPMAAPVSRTWQAVDNLNGSPFGPIGAFAWGLGDALILPAPAEVELAAFAGTRPKWVVPQALAVAAGSTAGVAVHVALARRGIKFPLLLTTRRMRAAAAGHLAVNEWGLRHQMFNGIPVKVYADEAAKTKMPLRKIVGAAAVGRGTKILAFGAVGTGVSWWSHPAARRLWGPWMIATGIGWALNQRHRHNRWS
ncbi:MAG: 1-acyl-sn-glycerol-3-phosphate acyltransferase [Micrococcales bacterium]|nr:MAG: 1-acyl-sn-glycerol-3-phosphate acyltransferase [Micrococcales bacterium]PIE26269.1 MAG: 1-acyl-sn-glycerol-3-phosphate acyltransferase [Micrococcales bacterium]